MALATIVLVEPRPALAQAAFKPPERVSGHELSILIRTTMVALHHANVTGNYTVLRDLGADSFKRINTPVRLGEIYAPIREAGLDLGQVVLFDPFLSKKPVIDSAGLLQIEGYFPTEPLAVVFKLAFRYEYEAWHIFSLAVGAQPLAELRPGLRPQSQQGPVPDQSEQTGTKGKANQEKAGPTGSLHVLPRRKPPRPQS